MDAALSTPESEEGDVATRGTLSLDPFKIVEAFVNFALLTRQQKNSIDEVDYAITRVYANSSGNGQMRVLIGKSDPRTKRSSMDDLLDKLLPVLRYIDCRSITIYTKFPPHLNTVERFLAVLRRRRFHLMEQLKIVFVRHAAPLRTVTKKNGFKTMKTLVDLRTFAFEENAWQSLQKILGIDYRMPDFFSSEDPSEITQAFMHSGLTLDPPVRVADVFAIAEVDTGEIKRTIITKNISLMFHAEEDSFNQLRKLFVAEGTAVYFPSLKLMINMAPCDRCCELIISFLGEMRQRRVFFDPVEIVFPSFYKFTEEANNPHVLGLKDLKANGVLLKTFDRNEWQHLGRVLRMADDWIEDRSLPWGARDERDKTLKQLLQTILSASEL